MIPLKHHELTTLISSVKELEDVKNLADLQSAAFATLELLNPGCLIGMGQVDNKGQKIQVTLSHIDSRSANFETMSDHIRHSPYIKYLQRGGRELALRYTDLLPPEELEKNPLWNEYFRPNKIPYGLFSSLGLLHSNKFLNIAIHHDHEFSPTAQVMSRIYLYELRNAFSRLIRQRDRGVS